MRHVWSIAAKELRGFFNSAVALIFLATFLGVVVFTFFWVDKFFARNLADVRPLFNWLPLLLIFLVAALTMRLWSEEQKLGTIEILLTLPVPLHRLVLGKFLAGLLLVALALAMTLGLPITVSMMGNLDWGPVIGGYLGALLLAGAYLSIGLCISSITDNQIVALIFTTLACALFYLPGTDAIVNLFGIHGQVIMRDLGTGSRFESIARGVVDIRDLVYYAGLIAFFLVLNTALLKAKRWSAGKRTAAQRHSVKLGVALVLANVIAANLWLAPIAAARVDLTQNNIFSLSPVTKKILRSTTEPLLIRGYFSKKTHPLLAPLVPQLEDLLREYAAEGGANVHVEFVDPSSNEDLQKEAQQDYGIKSVPFRFATRNEASVVNAYFDILVKYGDQYQVLTFNDLIDVKAVDIGDIEVKLRNPEYAITRAIKKVVYGFQSVDNLFASLPSKAVLTAYLTPSTLPAPYAKLPDTLKTVAGKLKDQSGGKFSYKMVVPKTEKQREALYKQYGFKPFRASILSNKVFYAHLMLKVGDKAERVALGSSVTAADLKSDVIAALKRAAPGFLKTVGLVVPKAPARPRNPMFQRRPRPPQSYRELRKQLSQDYEVRPVRLESGKVSDDIDVLVLAGPEHLGKNAQRAVDQYLMRGGAVIVLAGRYRLDTSSRSLRVAPLTTGLEKMLASYGAKIQGKMVLDEQNDSFPIPVTRNLGGLKVRQIKLLPYPFFVLVRQDGMSQGNIITSGLQQLTLHWASPIADSNPGASSSKGKGKNDKGKGKGKGKGNKVAEQQQVKREVLLKSSDDSWVQSSPDIQPNFELFPHSGFGKPQGLSKSEKGPKVLAVALTGRFKSYFAKDADKGKGKDAASKGKPDQLIKYSVPNARLVVVGSSNFVSDEVLGLAQQSGSQQILANLQFVQNLVDWAVTDTDLLSIRSRGGYTRVLEIKDAARGRWELINYAIIILALLGVAVVTVIRRRTLEPLQLGAKPSKEA